MRSFAVIERGDKTGELPVGDAKEPVPSEADELTTAKAQDADPRNADGDAGLPGSGEPAGDPVQWFRRAEHLLESGNPEAALVLLERVAGLEPESSSVQEARARALFDTGRLDESAAAFEAILTRSPDNDYAHFGLGMCLWRQHAFVRARDELAMAFVMRPGRADYARALTQVKATLQERLRSGLPLDGPLGPGRQGG